MRKFRLIYNAGAGQNKFKPFVDDVIGVLCDNGCEVTVFRASQGHNVDDFIINTPKDTDGIIVAGGDGTLNRVVNIMMKHNVDVPLGIIPAGTSNDFATHLKISTDFVECAKRILEGEPEFVDIGRVNDSYFVNVLSAGLFASTSYKTDKKLKEKFGQLSYFMTAATQTFQYEPLRLKIETEDAVYEEKAAVFVIFNGSSVGRIDKFTDNSSVQDGKLDLVLLRDCKLNDIVKIVGEIEDRTYLENPNVIYMREGKYKISLLDGKCDRPDTDGDAGPDFPLDVECIANKIKIFM